MVTRRFTVRIKGIAGSLVGIVDGPAELEVEEICPICEDRGIIWHLHSDSEEHKGSPEFSKRKLRNYR